MSAENKPKIDLKARLGKKTVSGRVGGPSIPPPVGIGRPPGMPGALGSSPLGSAPLGSAPLGSASQPPQRIDPSNPYLAMEAAHAPVRAEPQAIKIEMSEEVVQAQKKGRTKVLVLAAVTAGLGLVIGFAVGGMSEKNTQAQVAVKGAQGLAKEVDEAGIQVQSMAEVLKSIGQKISEGNYPEEEITKLGGIDIPFDGTNLAGKGIGRFKPQLVNQLIQFSAIATEADEQKDKIRRLLTSSRDALQALLDDKTNPKVRWAVYVENGPYGPWASMQPVPEPFLVKSDQKVKDKDGKESAYTWPQELKIKSGNETVSLKRYSKGEAVQETPEFIPVVPQTQGLVCPSDVVMRLRREVGSMEQILRGDPTPGHEKPGLIDLGQQIVEQLKKIGASGS